MKAAGAEPAPGRRPHPQPAGPRHIDVDEVRRELAAIPGVDDVHDLHVWTLTTGMDVATVHLASAESNGTVLRRRARC